MLTTLEYLLSSPCVIRRIKYRYGSDERQRRKVDTKFY